MLNFRIEATSACPANAGVFGHLSSGRLSGEILDTGIKPYIHVCISQGLVSQIFYHWSIIHIKRFSYCLVHNVTIDDV